MYFECRNLKTRFRVCVWVTHCIASIVIVLLIPWLISVPAHHPASHSDLLLAQAGISLCLSRRHRSHITQGEVILIIYVVWLLCPLLIDSSWCPGLQRTQDPSTWTRSSYPDPECHKKIGRFFWPLWRQKWMQQKIFFCLMMDSMDTILP